MEEAFLLFGGVPVEVLLDNARALVEHHDASTREVRFNAKLHAFARYWGFRPRACAPYRARTKGKDERGRSEEHTSELQSLMRISYAVFCLKKKKINIELIITNTHLKNK